MILYIILGIVGLLVLLMIGGLVAARMQTPDRDQVVHGPKDGSLAHCPETPNCVSTVDSEDDHAIDPIEFDGSSEEAIGRAKRALERLPRTTIIDERADYLRAESRSAIFGFIDDVEVYLPGDGRVHFRSASRVGKSDMGVNRKRYEKFKAAFRE
jgi:uncharacterized protein (DUF1499 family)